tara:strand:+ start:80 stop:1375 length:1296 start_codon:yes stop_codon:yes gene_type:complete
MESSVTVEAKIKSCSSKNVVIELNIPLVRSMLTGEDVIQAALNAAGELATAELLKLFDTDGSPIEIGSLRFTSKGEVSKEYETPYGKINIDRHVYQNHSGGNTFCPMDKDARIIGSATPKLAKQISNKYSRSSVDEVKDDLKSNHSRSLSRGHIQNIAEKVGNIAISKEEDWGYVPKFESEVSTIAIGMDGAMMLMRDDGYREAMSGTITFYDDNGDRLHTDYIASTPEYGKSQFFNRMNREIEKVKKIYPQASYVGIADGASDNWTFLESHTTKQITDFYHASEYLAKASQAIFNKNQEKKRIIWLEEHCHNLKHEQDSVIEQLEEFKNIASNRRLSASNKEKLDATITYFTNQGPRMNYAEYKKHNYPIGSGVTEAACKTTIKQRLCRSGMRWKDRGAAIVLRLKCLDKSKRWEQFWSKINQYGVPAAA